MTGLPAPRTGMHDELVRDLREMTNPAAQRVADEMIKRRDLGLERYGTLLQPHNGRDCLLDLLEELLDAAAYCRQARWEEAFVTLSDDGATMETMILGCAGAVLTLMDER